MSAIDLLSLTVQLAFLYLTTATAIDYLRNRHPTGLNIFLVFASLSATILVQFLSSLFNIQAEWFTLLGSIAILVHPYLLLRLAAYYRPSPRWIRWAAIGGLLISEMIIIVVRPLTSPVILPVILYFAGFEIYVAVVFVQGALNRRGAARERLRMAAAGSSILGIVFLVAGFAVILPQIGESIGVFVQVVALASSIAFYLAFATPHWLRQAWRSDSLLGFLRASTALVGSDSDHQSLLAFLSEIAAGIVGGTAAFVAVRAIGDDDVKLIAGSQGRSTPIDIAELVPFIQSLDESRSKAVVIDKSQSEAVRLQSVFQATGSALIYFVPIRNSLIDVGYLIVLATQQPLFFRETLDFLELLAQQSTLVLENQRLIDQLNQANVRLEDKIFAQTGQLIESETRYHRIMDDMLEGFQIVDFDWRYVYVNNSAARYGRLARESLLGHTVMEKYPGIEDTDMFATMQRCMEDRVARMDEFEFVYEDGRRAWFQFSIQPVTEGISILSLDITEQKLAEEAQGAAEIRFARVLETTAEAVISIDASQRIILFNQSAEKMFGYRAEETLGQPLDKLLPPQVIEQHRHFIGEFAEGRDIARGMGERGRELFARRKEGGVFPIEASISKLTEGDQVILTVFISDITERKQAEDALLSLNEELEQRVVERTTSLEAVNQELEAFSYSVSHDLRAPLRAMAGFSRILSEKYAAELPERAQHFANRIHENAEHMGELIDDLLTLSRLGRRSLEMRRVDPEKLVRSILRELEVATDYPQIAIIVDPLPNCEADPTLLKQIYLNLITNALKFSATTDAPQIHIGFQDSDGDRVYFVKDNGVGFDMRHADKLFGVFERLHSSRDYEGTGIGLATVQRAVQRHRGRVWAESDVGKGASFYFTLALSGELEYAE